MQLYCAKFILHIMKFAPKGKQILLNFLNVISLILQNSEYAVHITDLRRHILQCSRITSSKLNILVRVEQTLDHQPGRLNHLSRTSQSPLFLESYANMHVKQIFFTDQ